MGFDPGMIANIAGAVQGGGESAGGGANMPMHVETPADTATHIAKPFEQYVNDTKAKAQILMSDPFLKQMTQPQQTPAQQPPKEEEKDKNSQQGNEDMMKMLDYVNAAKKQNELKQGANAAGASSAVNIPLQTT